MLKSMETYLK